MFSEPSFTAKSWDRAMRLLRRYHRYEVVGVEHFPRSGSVLVASTHSLATYENFMLGSVCAESLGRRPTILVDDLVFKLPAVGPSLREIGLEPGKRERAIEILNAGGIIGLGPGGMREALRSSKDKYTFSWEGRYGFVKVAMMAGAPIVLAACPRADDIYDVADIELTPEFYKRYHFPLPLFRGLGPTLAPRPIKLWHVMSQPILSEVPPEEVTQEAVEAHYTYLCERMQELMDRACRISGI